MLGADSRRLNDLNHLVHFGVNWQEEGIRSLANQELFYKARKYITESRFGQNHLTGVPNSFGFIHRQCMQIIILGIDKANKA